MKELIELAKEKGFESDIGLGYCKSEFNNDKDIVYFAELKRHLWMCELQKWLMIEFKIFAYIDYETFEYVFIEHGNGIIREKIPNISNDINDWPKWFEGLLIEALKII